DRGWNQVFQAALHFYLALNILFCFPELWDPTSREARNKKKSEEYRGTLMYQKTVRTWTLEGSNNEVPRYPHRQFFGLEDHFHQSAFLNCSTVAGFQPDVTDTARVELYLRMKGLPQELVWQITALADYDSQRPRRLPIPHDPLHRDNHRALRQYLTFCWQIMVRCNMLAQEVGIEINWVSEVVHALQDMASAPGRPLFTSKWDESFDYRLATMQGGSGELPYTFRYR
ncbi:uncharacterized protein BO80DRAFT_369676, partial [Aspergillus ibericus CBS 121593]